MSRFMKICHFRFTTWCENRDDADSNCNGRVLKVRVETKQSANSDPEATDHQIRISSRNQMQTEDDYFRPQTSDLPSIEGSFFQIAIYDDDLCIKIQSIEIFAYVCKEETVDLALFRKTIAPFDRTSVEVRFQFTSKFEIQSVFALKLTTLEKCINWFEITFN